MSVGPPFSSDARPAPANARMSGAVSRFDVRLRHAIGDLFLPDEARLDDRTRAAVRGVLAGVVGAAEADVRRHAARLLTDRGETRVADALLRGEPVLDRLMRSGVLRDPELMGELIARVELDLLAEALPAIGPEPGGPGLIVRLADCPDGVIAAAARALAAAEHRRRGSAGGTGPARTELPAELHHRLAWWIAAAIREQANGTGDTTNGDRAIAEATLRSLATHDEGDRPEAAAARLADALDARPNELATLLVEAIGDRQPTFFVAALGRAVGLDYDQARRLILDPRGDLLLLAQHAVGVERSAMARIGVALADADPRRDLEALADAIDWVTGHDRDAARIALAPLRLPRDFRLAARALSGNAA